MWTRKKKTQNNKSPPNHRDPYRKTIQIEYKKLIKIAYLMPKCWGNINCLKKTHPSLLVIAEKTVILAELPTVPKSESNSTNGYYSWGRMSRASGTVSKWKSRKLQSTLFLRSWVRESVNPGVVRHFSPVMPAAQWVFPNPLRFNLQVKPSKS